ncbi:membrane-anchored adenylyl cyclase domain protein [Mycobacterium ulcerans str. Harvey]|uniref:Membrane-anchored adenylyl cyclase domain protein n=1 Tax=Mycobacterium ulcerans str. Harvey TaxID=1299332 RepID=A0ABP3A8Y1_MYCUL|nr:membrane-anchored adenylyl cyclase domain protein [Mycobacterium ulcerans str. Harvey]
MRFTEPAEYVFRHPLIHTVAYESQLKSARAQMHRRLAAVIEARVPESADQYAALIAEHLEAAGESHAAYGWQVRAAAWATNRDIAAAHLTWERARKIADALPVDDPNRAAMRIAPRTMLCGIAFRIHIDVAGARFEELRELCAAAGDKASLSIGMAGLVIDHLQHARMREASQLATEAMTLIESVGDPALTVALSIALIYAKSECAEWSDALRWSQRVIALADGDPTMGALIIGCPWRWPSPPAPTRAIAWGVRGGQKISSMVWRWPAAPIPCPMPPSSPTSTARASRPVSWRPTIARSARSRTLCKSPSVPVTMSRWPSPG